LALTLLAPLLPPPHPCITPLGRVVVVALAWAWVAVVVGGVVVEGTLVTSLSIPSFTCSSCNCSSSSSSSMVGDSLGQHLPMAVCWVLPQGQEVVVLAGWGG
jgi:hypothetical protein